MDDEQDKPNQTIRIYVGAERRARMAALTEDLNWSAIAQAAFDRAIGQEEWKTMEGAVKGLERLRAELNTYRDTQYEKGLADGREWALDKAPIAELLIVARLRDHEHEDCLVAITQALDELPVGVAEDAGDSYAGGFIAGAGAVYDEV